MSHKEHIKELAALRNISNEYLDFCGEKKQVPTNNIELILQAMGYDINDNYRLGEHIEQLKVQKWRNLLEPVIILNPLRKQVIQLCVKSDDLSQSGCWVFVSEQGEQSFKKTFKAQKLYQCNEIQIDHIKFVCLELPIPQDLPLGYHKITVSMGTEKATASLIITPATSYQSDNIKNGKKVWGSAIQLYTLRSDRNWGMGDFTDLAQLLTDMAGQGAHVIGLNPLHALYPISPEHASPYSPSNRNFLNPLYIDIENVAEFKDAKELQAKISGQDFKNKLEELRRSDGVDYTSVSFHKYSALKQLYLCFQEKHSGKNTKREKAFKAFLNLQGKPLYEHALFEALLEYFKAKDINAWGWPTWPEAYQDHTSQVVQQFAAENENSITYYLYLQFLADEQLIEIDRLSKTLNMEIGLYRDLAVGPDRGGSETWTNREKFCLSASVGAPPDDLCAEGQNWSLPPIDPYKMKQEKYQSFIHLLRNNMRACGALRIDHAMAMLRLWWCPPDKTAAYGAYVYYDLLDMLGILNLESQRNACMVIAEDLGTVPPEVIEYFPKANLFSNKVFYFEIDPENCTAPDRYAPKALAMISNHDLPTIKAFWHKNDLELRLRLEKFETYSDYENACEARDRNKKIILKALKEHGFFASDIGEKSHKFPAMSQSLNFAIHAYLASSSSQIITIQLEDFMLIDKPVNIPGTHKEYPNWRRKLTESSRILFARPEIKKFCQQLNNLRNQD